MVAGQTVFDEEPLARFLFSSGWFSSQNRLVKPGVFLPPPDLKLSVFRIAEMPPDDVRQLGATVANERNLYGHAAFAASEVRTAGLSIDPDDTPPRHANLVGWATDKAEQKLAAMELARRSQPVLYTA